MQGEAEPVVSTSALLDMAEVFINNEFVAALYREVDEGETSYQLQMAILDMDLEGV